MNPLRTAIHSGKLGDIIYALPACRALGINHLIINCMTECRDPLRVMDRKSGEQLVPLLMNQPNIEKVEISSIETLFEDVNQKLEGVSVNFDHFRNIAKHRVGYVLQKAPEILQEKLLSGEIVHLTQMFAATAGLKVDAQTSWLTADPSPDTHGKIAVSINPRWRSFPNWYWSYILRGLNSVVHLENQNDHLELASKIAGAKLFLGTVSFPYAIAEGLKIPRMVEVCYSNLNAFPLDSSGKILPPDMLEARRQISEHLDTERAQYERMTKKLSYNPIFLGLNAYLKKAVSLSQFKSGSPLREKLAFLRTPAFRSVKV